MKNLSYRIIAVLLALVIGVVIGTSVMTQRKDKVISELKEQHKNELKARVQQSLNIIAERDREIKRLKDTNKVYAETVDQLIKKIEQDGVRIMKLRKLIPKMTTNEKVDFLRNRYSADSIRNK